MAIKEVFMNPTVKEVIFQIRFPNLFYIENKIGEIQTRIMEKFPKSALLFRRKLLFADVGPEGKIEEIPSVEGQGKKIWRFNSDNNFQLNILSDSLDITSSYHKTYNLGDGDKFRDIIKYVMDNFLAVVSLPIINRIGLRYVDECPVLEKTNSTFAKWYNTAFPLSRFSIDNAIEMSFNTTLKRSEYCIRYVESLAKHKNKEEYKLVLDYDGYAVNIKSSEYLKTTDELHDLISNEYENTIKEPVYEYMRHKKEE
ncbi:MAG: TIGR04255 family protein [Candidatus Omnitrophota bacterium]